MTSIELADLRSDINGVKPGLTSRLLRSFYDMKGVTQELISEKPSEARLFMFVQLSNMIFVLAWCLRYVFTENMNTAQLTGANIVLWLIFALMLRTTAIYALALVIGTVMRVIGATANLQDIRTGVFWGAFVAAPFGLLIAELAVIMNALDGTLPFLQHEGIQLLPYWLGVVPFVWFVSKGIATANKMENSIPVFGAISAAAVILAFLFKLIVAI